MQIVECVPNFSEGRDMEKIRQITDEITAVSGVTLLDVDPGADTNRTVVTFVGAPDAVAEGAFRAIQKAAQILDMRIHHGEHPRMGATDVCPFIPVSGVTMDECVAIARKVGARVGEELQIPVYLYEFAALSEPRRNLAFCRSGEYEGLRTRFSDPEWAPDFGPAEFNARSGATAIGARKFLIAFNANLNTRDPKLAKKIAFAVREKGTFARNQNGLILRDNAGEPRFEPGLLKAVKGTGWYIDEYQCAQVTMNLTDLDVTPFHVAYEAVVEQAEKNGVRVFGGEVVGLIPKDAMLAAGRYYMQKQDAAMGVPEGELIRVAVQSMNLGSVHPFLPNEKIIEYRIRETASELRSLSVIEFMDELASDSPAPGGGSVAALGGALSASLSAMVANLTFRKKGYLPVWKRMNELAEQAQSLKRQFLIDIDRDTDAFNRVMSAFSLPQETPDQKNARAAAVQEANKEATRSPFRMMEKTREVIRLAQEVAEHGNQSSLSDAGVAGLAGQLAAWGAYYNILINLKGIDDPDFCDEMRNRAVKILDEVEITARKIRALMEQRLA